MAEITEKLDRLELAVGRLETIEKDRPRNTLKAVIGLLGFGLITALGWVWQAGATFERLDQVTAQVSELKDDVHEITEQVVKLRERTYRIDQGEP